MKLIAFCIRRWDSAQVKADSSAQGRCVFHTALKVIALAGFFHSFPVILKAQDAGRFPGQTGTIAFVLETDKTYLNGKGDGVVRQSLVKFPGVMEIFFRRSDPSIGIYWAWERDGRIANDIIAELNELPGPEDYHLLYTWDSARGISEAYLNGHNLRLPGMARDPYWIEAEAVFAVIGQGPLKVKELEITAQYTPPELAQSHVSPALLGRRANLLGFPQPPEPMDIAARRGALLYHSSMQTPKSLEGWVAEGPLDVGFGNGYCILRSEDLGGHFVFWCPQEFPDSFMLEWWFQPFSDDGLAIVFFAAMGENGESIFDPLLPQRDGAFRQYVLGALTSYHISYYANMIDLLMGRIDSNLRKNNNFYRVGGGPVAVKPGSPGWQQMTLVKDRNRIQLFSNGKICVDWTDEDAERYGPPLSSGYIGLRQMAPFIAAYRDFKVYALKESAK